MNITSFGHAGLFVETSRETILCDPWANAAYLGTWYPFPDNEWLDWAAFINPDYLYVSHLHQDHFDPLLLSTLGKKQLVLLHESIIIDFRSREVRSCEEDQYEYQFWIPRRIAEWLVLTRQEDWVNTVFLSLRFVASRSGRYNEAIYAFFSSLSRERALFVENFPEEPPRKLTDSIVISGWRIQRNCPHRGGDLAEFGHVDGDDLLTCRLHGWRFNLVTGRCLSSDDYSIYAERDFATPDTDST